MDYLIVFVLGAICGYFYIIVKSYLLVRKLMQEIEHKEDTRRTVPERTVTVEVHNNELYAYDKDTSQFICKFSYMNELKDNLRRFDKKCDWFVDVNFDKVVSEHIKE